MAGSRYQNKAKVRILIDDENAGSGSGNAAGIDAARGVKLSAFVPLELGGGNALRRVSNSGSYLDSNIKQVTPGGTVQDAKSVRGVQKTPNQKTANGSYVPPGADIKGKILSKSSSPTARRSMSRRKY
jgi:hypothetical protein